MYDNRDGTDEDDGTTMSEKKRTRNVQNKIEHISL